MEIGQEFNQLTLEEYFFYIDNYKNTKILIHLDYIVQS